jgi:hypothetical protein
MPPRFPLSFAAVLAILAISAGLSHAGPPPSGKEEQEAAVIHFGTPPAPQVRVFAIHDGTKGEMRTNYAVVPSPFYAVPGKLKVIYACPNAEFYSYDNVQQIEVPESGVFYLSCNVEGSLVLVRRGET